MSRAWTHKPPAHMSPEERYDEVIAILAIGLARLAEAPADAPQELSESGQIGLELSDGTRLSVPRG